MAPINIQACTARHLPQELDQVQCQLTVYHRPLQPGESLFILQISIPGFLVLESKLGASRNTYVVQQAKRNHPHHKHAKVKGKGPELVRKGWKEDEGEEDGDSRDGECVFDLSDVAHAGDVEDVDETAEDAGADNGRDELDGAAND